MHSPRSNHGKRATEEERTSIQHNTTFSTLNSGKTQQLQVKPIQAQLVYKTKHNPDGFTQFTTWLVMKGYLQTDFCKMYACIGKLTTLQYLINHIWKHQIDCNIHHLDIVTTYIIAKMDDYNNYITWPERWPEGLNFSLIILRLRKALYDLKQAQQLWHNNISAGLLSPGLTQLSCTPNLDLCRSLYSVTAVNRWYLNVVHGYRFQSHDWSRCESHTESNEQQSCPSPMNGWASRFRNIVPESVPVRWPTPPQLSVNLPRGRLMMFHDMWIPMYSSTQPSIRGRKNWRISPTIMQSWVDECHGAAGEWL